MANLELLRPGNVPVHGSTDQNYKFGILRDIVGSLEA